MIEKLDVLRTLESRFGVWLASHYFNDLETIWKIGAVKNRKNVPKLQTDSKERQTLHLYYPVNVLEGRPERQRSP